MSDERSTASESGDDAGPDDDLEPGGGPRRVVSEESVDDILESLDGPEPNDEPAAVTETRESVTVEFDEGEVPDPDDTTGDEGEAATVDDEKGEATTDDGGEAATIDDGPSDDADGPSDDAPSPNAAAVDADQSTGDDSLEDLAARVERGTVTGADVRAAEAGEGRESTPEIDEVDLSVDDLETGGGVTDDDPTDDAGPLAGSIDRDADADEAETDAGLVGRLKRFFLG